MRGPDRTAQVASAHWETLTEEAGAIAAGFEEEGWETLVVHPGSATAVHEHERCGLDVLIPGNEPLAALVEERGLSFPRSEVYSREEARETFDRATEEGSFRTDLRKLSGETVVFSHDDPSIFRPDR